MTPQPKYLAPFKAFLEKLQSDVASVAFAVDVDAVSEWRGFVPFELDALEADSLICEALGPVAGEFLKYKRMEWIEYMRFVSDWEIRQYLEVF